MTDVVWLVFGAIWLLFLGCAIAAWLKHPRWPKHHTLPYPAEFDLGMGDER